MTIFTAYNDAKKALKAAGIESANFEAKQIIKYVTGYSNSEILSLYNSKLSPFQQTAYNSILNRRLSRYPLQYILGEWSFYGLDFLVGEGVLVPRADTETLVEAALDLLKEKENPAVLDLCSGSGCIAVAIAKNKICTVDALEKYDAAYEYLEKNIEKNNVHVTAIKGDVFSFTPERKYDLIVSNPPYISADGMGIIDEETSHEPDSALYGGEDGMLFHRCILSRYRKYLKTGGTVALEIGFDQADSVKDLFFTNSFHSVGIKNDYSGVQRVVFGTVGQI